ncbi:MAG: hypothetical protein H6R44_741 [Nitrospirae bacterium]|nr:hypothetical protein [Nitrospirota bacterium]
MVSGQVSRVMPRLAEESAMGTANARVMMREPMVRSRVFRPVRRTSCNTGWPVRMEVPKSPRSMFPSHARY